VVGVGTTPVAAARVLTLMETDPLVELAPSVYTVGDGGHAVVAWGVVVDGAEVSGMPP
jgi:hypothetical protein